METIIEGLKVVFFGVLMFSIIVTIHEAGHFTAARLFGLRVKEFMLGLPGPNVGFTFKGTKFGVTPILLGGYALIAGEGSVKENPNLAAAYAFLSEHGTLDEDRARAFSADVGYDLEEALDVLDAWGTIKRTKTKGRYTYSMVADGGFESGAPRVVEDANAHIAAERKLTFNAAPWYQRVIILAAGVFFNLLFAVVVITAFYMISGVQTPTTTIETVVESSPAATSGIQAGDMITSFDGTPVDSWEALTSGIATKKPGDEVTLAFERAGSPKEVTLKLADNNGTPMVGVSPTFEAQRMSFVDAAGTSFSYIGLVTQFIIKLFNPATTGEVISQSTSVVGVSFVAKDAAESGFVPFIVLSAMLSISIGLMNLLPLPPLDGGRIIVETIERVTRRRIPLGIVNAITLAAFALLIMLFLVLTTQDIRNFIIGN
jgi:regulator of sigma E protease